MHGRIKTGTLCLMLLAATALEGGVTPRIQVDNKADQRIEIVPIDDLHRTSIPQSLSDLSLALPPGSFILVNRTKTAITAVVVRWTYTDANGELKQTGMNCDAYVFAPLDPIVNANARSLITPYGCTKEELFPRLATGAIIGSPLTPVEKPMSPDPNTTIHIYLDSVIFEDGLIWGPDKFRYHLEIQDRYSSVQKFVDEVASGKAAGEDMSALLTRVRNDAQSKPDASSSRASSRRAYYAGLLLRSPNPEGTLSQLKGQIPLPVFRHLGAQ